MKEYRKAGVFNYNGYKYQILLDDESKYFFLKIKNNTYNYITLSELLTFMNIFVHDKNVYLLDNYKSNDYKKYNIDDYINNSNYNNKKEKSKIKLIPKIIIGGLVVPLTLSTITLIGAFVYNQHTINERFNNYSQAISTEEYYADETTRTVEAALAQIEEEKSDFQVETRDEFGNTIIIYDSSQLDDILGPKESVTYDDIRQTITTNPNINGQFQDIYLDLANHLEEQYPDMDLRIWKYNLETLTIVECDEFDMHLAAMNSTANACYRKDENTIYTVKDYEYVPGSWEYQVIVHEMCHPIRTSYFDYKGKTVRAIFENSDYEGAIVGECLNSLLALRSYDQDEMDIAYQLQSNMIEVIVECTDNYDYQDFVEHNITYFEQVLNEQNGNDLAIDVFTLMNLQYEDYHNDDISVDQEQFYLVYDYISNMYYNKYLNSNMSYEEACQVRDRLIYKITYDVPEEYNIDINHFNEYFDNYCNELGIVNARVR